MGGEVGSWDPSSWTVNRYRHMAAIMMRNNVKFEMKRGQKTCPRLYTRRGPIISQWVLVKYWGVDKLWQRLWSHHVLHVNQLFYRVYKLAEFWFWFWNWHYIRIDARWNSVWRITIICSLFVSDLSQRFHFKPINCAGTVAANPLKIDFALAYFKEYC